MDGTLHLYTSSNCPTSIQKEFIEFTEFIEFIDRFKVEKLDCVTGVNALVQRGIYSLTPLLSK